MPRDTAADPFAAVHKAAQAVIELELEAGIAGPADRARGGVFGYDITSETPLFSKASAEEGRGARRYEHEAAARRTRPIYFGVADPDLRRRLIAASRAVDAAYHLASAESVAAARLAVAAAVRNGGTRPVPEIIGACASAASVWAAYTWAGCAVAMAILALVAAATPSTALALIARRDAAIRAADEELRQAQENAEEAYSLAPASTRTEERTGEPDPLL